MGYKFAGSTCSVFIGDGRRAFLRRGQAWSTDAEVVKLHPELFQDDPLEIHGVDFDDEAPVEQATQAPGEKRNTRRRAK